MRQKILFTQKFAVLCLVTTVIVSVLVAPFIIAGGLWVKGTASSYTKNADTLLKGYQPGSVIITDSQGKTIASLYSHDRKPVSFEDISPLMIKSILSIEDRRFMDHHGVDWQGTTRAFLTNFTSGHIEQGASTLTQQYVKNYLLLVEAQNDQERQLATAATTARKLREARLAMTLESSLTQIGIKNGLSPKEAELNTKRQILKRYLNLVYFGHDIYGVERAAEFYFGTTAKELSLAQAATLAGMLQSTARFDPYVHPKEVISRRNIVLDTISTNFPQLTTEAVHAKTEGLGVVPNPQRHSNQCATSHNNGYFCDYVLRYLAKQGYDLQELEKHHIRIKTTLDPDLQQRAVEKIQSIASPHLSGIAEVANFIKPGNKTHDIMAMVSSRNYGLDSANDETLLPEPSSLIGDGAGSVFKIFTTAAAMEKGMGINASLSVPAFLSIEGMGSSDNSPGCPPKQYCVRNDGRYQAAMTVPHALAVSPNTAFVKLLQTVGVPPAVDMAVRLGLRSYAEPGTSINGKQSIADFVKKQNLGSFTLGPLPVNDLELANVAATLASHGVWCPPNPIISLEEPDRDAYGSYVYDSKKRLRFHTINYESPKCEQVVSPGLADTLSNALSYDNKGSGTSAASAARAGWFLPVSAKTGTTETHRSSAFIGYTQHYAGAVYVLGDTHPQPICSAPLRPCWGGNIYGGKEPAYTWYSIMAPIAKKWGEVSLPKTDPKYVDGSDRGHVPSVTGKNLQQMKAALKAKGFPYAIVYMNSTSEQGTVLGTYPSGSVIPGTKISINVSNGVPPPPPPPPRSSRSHNGGGGELDIDNPDAFTPQDGDSTHPRNAPHPAPRVHQPRHRDATPPWGR